MARTKATKSAKPTWLDSRWARLIAAAVGLALSYAFASRAIDSGSLWHYLGSLVFLVLSIKMLVRAIRR